MRRRVFYALTLSGSEGKTAGRIESHRPSFYNGERYKRAQYACLYQDCEGLLPNASVYLKGEEILS